MKGLSLLLSLSLLLPLAPASAADVDASSLAVGPTSRADVLKAEAPKMQTALLSDDVSSLKASILVAGTADLILPEGDTPLTLALRAESKRSTEYLLGLEDVDVTKRNRFGESPLMLAVFKANDKAMEAMRQAGPSLRRDPGERRIREEAPLARRRSERAHEPGRHAPPHGSAPSLAKRDSHAPSRRGLPQLLHDVGPLSRRLREEGG